MKNQQAQNLYQAPKKKKLVVDLQKLDPSWNLARDHGKAQAPGIQIDPRQRLGSLVVCPCCLQAIDKEPISLWQNSKQLFFLGYGFPLFYNNLQFCILSVFFLILIQSGLLLYMSIIDNGCQQYLKSNKLQAAAGQTPYRCTGSFVMISRVSGQVTVQQLLTRIFSFVAQLFLLLYFRDNQRKMAAYHIERNNRITDYCLIFKNLPKVMGIKKKITDFLTSRFSGPKLTVKNIILIPTIDEYHDKEEQKQKIINKKRNLMNKKGDNSSLFEKIDRELEHLNEQMNRFCLQIAQKSEHDQLYAQKAIVVLNNQQEKVRVLKQFPKMPKSQLQDFFIWMADDVVIQQAPDPKQIIWKNINFPKDQRWVKILQGWIVTILVLGAITAIFYGFIRAKAQRLDLDLHGESGYTDQQFAQATAIVFIAIACVQFFNKFLLKIILHKIADYQMPETTAEHQFSYALKYTLGMFFTTAVMTLAVEAIQFENYSGQYGVVEEQTIMFFFNSLFVPLLWITHPQYYIKHAIRKYKINSQDLTQKQANELMEQYPYDTGKRYAEIIQTMWFTFLYSSLIPLGALLTLPGLVIYYWVDKYNLLRRSSISNKIQSSLPLNAIKLLQITILWKPIGQFLFDLQLRNVVYPSTIAMICVGFVYLILPWNSILDFFFDEKFNIKTVSYDLMKPKFREVYQNVDPIRKHLAIHKIALGRKMSNNYEIQFRDYDAPIQPDISAGVQPDISTFEINLVTNNDIKFQENKIQNLQNQQ